MDQEGALERFGGGQRVWSRSARAKRPWHPTDRVRELYKDSETIRLLTPLLARPRERWITAEDVEG